MELLEQEVIKEEISSKGKEFSSHKEANEYISKQFEGIISSEVESLVSYLNSELAQQRFNADVLNEGKKRSDSKDKTIAYLRNLEFYTTENNNDFVMQYQFIGNKITLNFHGCKALEYDQRGKLKKISHRYSESEMRLILYHELLHATGLYTEWNDIIRTKFPLEELKRNIKDNPQIVSEERYISNPNEIYPRLKIIQNFLVNKNIELTAENLYTYFYQLWRLRNSGEHPTDEIKSYFSEPLDDGHKRLLYETFIIGLHMDFEEKNKKTEINKLDRLVMLLKGLVSINDKHIVQSIG